MRKFEYCQIDYTNYPSEEYLNKLGEMGWDKTNKLKPFETAGGHRRYDTDALDKFLGKK